MDVYPSVININAEFSLDISLIPYCNYLLAFPLLPDHIHMNRQDLIVRSIIKRHSAQTQ